MSVAAFLDSFHPAVQAYRANGDPKPILKQIGQNSSNDPTLSTFYPLVLILLQYPVVYMKMLVSLVYMDTFGPKITNTIKTQIVTYGDKDLEKLKQADSNIVYALGTDADKLVKAAKTWYQLFIKVANNQSPEYIRAQISTLVRIANRVLGFNIGDKFLAAAQSAVYASASAGMLKSVGIKNNLIQGSQSDAEKIVNDLLAQATSLNL